MSSSKVRESLGVIESPRLGLVRSMRYPLALSRLLMIRFTSGDPFGWIREVHPETSLLFRCTSACRTIIEILVAALFQLADRLPEDYNLVCCPPMLAEFKGVSPLRAIGHRHSPDSWIIPIQQIAPFRLSPIAGFVPRRESDCALIGDLFHRGFDWSSLLRLDALCAGIERI